MGNLSRVPEVFCFEREMSAIKEKLIMGNFEDVIIDVGADELKIAYDQPPDSEDLSYSPAAEGILEDVDIPDAEPVILRQKLEGICRCCLTESDELKSIFEPDDCISSMIFLLTSIQLSKEDGFPSNVCMECLLQLTRSINFKQQVETADMTLKQFVTEGYFQGMMLQKVDIEQMAKRLSDYNDLDFISAGNNLEVSDAEPTHRVNKDTVEISKVDKINVPLLSDFSKISEMSKKNCGRRDKKRSKSKKVKSKSLHCTVCDKNFLDPNSYMIHVKTHPEGEALFCWCSVCYRSFKDHKSMEYHYRCHQNKSEINETEKQFKCKDCDQSFAVETDLYIHGSVHETSDKIICRKCLKEFPSECKLKRHIRIHFQDKPYKCKICGKGFPEMGSLTRHFRLHTGEKRERKYICNICGKSYFDSHSLSVHTRTHTGEKPWECKECGKAFIDSRLLNSHQKIHKEEKMYACDRCGKRFTHQSTLTTHIRIHTGEKPYTCYICQKSFIQSSNLNLHMRVHSGEKPYQCKICSRAFASSSTLTTHMRTHTGEKPYACPQCDKMFARHDLNAHIRSHTGEKPFNCDVCFRKFTTSGQLNQHKRSHNTEKSFICQICNKSLSTEVYLKKHMKIHTAPEIEDQSFQIEKLNNLLAAVVDNN